MKKKMKNRSKKEQQKPYRTWAIMCNERRSSFHEPSPNERRKWKFGKWKWKWKFGVASRKVSTRENEAPYAGCIINEPDFRPTECRCNFPITHRRYQNRMHFPVFDPLNDLWVLVFGPSWHRSPVEWLFGSTADGRVPVEFIFNGRQALMSGHI